MWKVVLPILISPGGRNEHWAVTSKRKRLIRDQFWIRAVKQKIPKASGPRGLKITRFTSGVGLDPADNLGLAAKDLIDEVIKLGYLAVKDASGNWTLTTRPGQGDGPNDGNLISVDQQWIAKRRDQRTEVELWNLT